jgi:MEMO1 family protein
MTPEQIRKPGFAGQFYPGSTTEIKKMLDVFIEQNKNLKIGRRPPILILPHAGWFYSGLAAVRGLLTLSKTPPKRAILIGPSHHHYFMGFSLSGYEKYRTPLGDLDVDLALQQTLASATGYDFEPEAHVHEHSLEVILPMLQYVVSDKIKIMPILAGNTSRASITILAEALASNCDVFTDVLIISSDLSHFFGYDEARSLDQETLTYILEEDSDSITERSGEGGRLACGHSGISVAIELAKLWGLGKPEVLIYYNSGDSGGDRDRVVGYASVAYPPPDLEVEPVA